MLSALCDNAFLMGTGTGTGTLISIDDSDTEVLGILFTSREILFPIALFEMVLAEISATFRILRKFGNVSRISSRALRRFSENLICAIFWFNKNTA